MDLKKALARDKSQESDDLNITPVMNIFLILVPFLLLTAVFVRISILEFSLPGSESEAQSANQQNPVVTVLSITEQGFELRTKGKKFPQIAKADTSFNFDALIDRLREVKSTHQETEDIIIAPSAAIKYDTIIKVMDCCRENGFPNISISG